MALRKSKNCSQNGKLLICKWVWILSVRHLLEAKSSRSASDHLDGGVTECQLIAVTGSTFSFTIQPLAALGLQFSSARRGKASKTGPSDCAVRPKSLFRRSVQYLTRARNTEPALNPTARPSRFDETVALAIP
jgi:hypothetical protein